MSNKASTFKEFRDLASLRDNLRDFYPQFRIHPGFDRDNAMHRQGAVDLAEVIVGRINEIIGDPMKLLEEPEED